jgi:thiamine biosynthesis lipoprotein
MAFTRRALFALNAAPAPAMALPAGWLRVHRTAMACRFEVTLAPQDSRHIGAALRALDEADRIESLLSIFRDSSELSRINRDAARGCGATVDEEVFALLQHCRQLWTETDGAFDITSTALGRCWGFLQRAGRVPSDDEIQAARRGVGMSRVALFDGCRVTFGAEDVELNFNAIGKGYALDRMARVLRREGVGLALLSAGSSSVLTIGAPRGGWTLDLQSPLIASTLARVRFSEGAIGTSGAGEQFIVDHGMRYGHVMDPQTGRPAHGVLSASAVTRDAATADALSTAFFVGGPALARRYCNAHPDTLALLVLEEATTPRIYGRFAGVRVE